MTKKPSPTPPPDTKPAKARVGAEAHNPAESILDRVRAYRLAELPNLRRLQLPVLGGSVKPRSAVTVSDGALRLAQLMARNAKPAATWIAPNSLRPDVTMSPVRSAADLGGLVRKERKKRRMTQQAFADLAGVGRRFVSELENGKPTLEFDKVLHVLTAAGVDLIARSKQ